MTLWLKVSRDRYELPEAVAGSQKELAAILGLHPSTIKRERTRAKSRGYKCCYVRVNVEENQDDD